MTIGRGEVLRIAKLANLELNEDEVDVYGGQLNHILDYIQKLNEVDISGVEPMAQVLFSEAAASGEGAAAPDSLRDDEVRPADVANAVLEQAPQAAPPYFRVPKVIER